MRLSTLVQTDPSIEIPRGRQSAWLIIDLYDFPFVVSGTALLGPPFGNSDCEEGGRTSWPRSQLDYENKIGPSTKSMSQVTRSRSIRATTTGKTSIIILDA